MESYFFLAIICFSQLCDAKDSTESVDGSPEDLESNEVDGISDNCDKKENNPPSYQWKKVQWPTSGLPSDAVFGGIDMPHLCGMIYVGRAWYKGNLLPAKIRGSDGMAFVSYKDDEVMVNESEILCTDHAIWKPIKETRIPKSAFPVGETEDGEILYMGRWFIDLRLTPGKVEASSKLLKMTYAHQTYRSSQYEILILKSGNDF